MHLGESGDRLATSHLQSSPQVLKMVVVVVAVVVEVGGCLSHFSHSLCLWNEIKGKKNINYQLNTDTDTQAHPNPFKYDFVSSNRVPT